MYDVRGFAARSPGARSFPAGNYHTIEAVLMLIRRALTTLAVLFIALTLAAEPALAQKNTLTIALNQDPDLLDPTPSRTDAPRRNRRTRDRYKGAGQVGTAARLCGPVVVRAARLKGPDRTREVNPLPRHGRAEDRNPRLPQHPHRQRRVGQHAIGRHRHEAPG